MFYGPVHFYDKQPTGRWQQELTVVAKVPSIPLEPAPYSNEIAAMPKVADIVEVVAALCGVTIFDLVAPTRRHSHKIPRLAVYWIARNFTLQSYPQIGRAVGRNHATIISGVKRVEKYSRTFRPVIEPALEILEKRGFYMMADVKFQ